MNISQLRAFCAVAQTGSITVAARILNRAPSGVTVRIKQLEEHLGCELFLREHQRMSLSSAGRKLLEHAQHLLDLCDSTHALMRGEDIDGRLVVGALDVALVNFIPQLISVFRQRYCGVVLDIRHQASEDLVAQVTNGTLDIALTEGPVTTKALCSKIAYVDEMILVTELAHPPVSCASQLVCRELYGFSYDCSFRFRMDRWLAQGGAPAFPIIEIESYHTMLACVNAGMGAAWMLRSVLNTLPGYHQVRSHSLGEFGHTEIHFVWRNGHLSRNAQLLIESGRALPKLESN